MEDVLRYIEGDKRVFLIGCSLCATTCRTGGEKELKELAVSLEHNGKKVTGSVVLDPACNILEVKRCFRGHSDAIKRSDVILSLACGGGTQAIGEVIRQKRIYPVNDTLFQGEISRMTLKEAVFEQKCSLCGECMLSETGGLCPVTRCPKGLMNGPCGGAKNGKCEIDKDLECIWIEIYERLKDRGQLESMKKARPPKDNHKNRRPQRLDVL